jgi:hypothetical protein
MWSSITIFGFFYSIIPAGCDFVCWTFVVKLANVCVGCDYYILDEECVPENAFRVDAFVEGGEN